MIKKTLSFLLVVILILSCNESGTDPIDNTEPGRRDYVWSADTLDLVYNDFCSIWGSSSNDVWIGTAQPGELYHSTGDKFEKWPEYVGSTQEAIYGFANDDVWLGGDDGKIYHYNGSKWEKIYTYKEDKFQGAKIRNFCGAPNALYAVGRTYGHGNYNEWTTEQYGFILYYNGYYWTEIFYADFQSQFTKIRSCSEGYFIFSVTLNNMDADTNYIYKWNTEEKILETVLKDVGNINFNVIDDRIVMKRETEIYEYRNGIFEQLNMPQVNDYIYQIYGRSMKDILIRTRKYILHYNGRDIEYLFHFNNDWVYSAGGVAIFENEVLFNCSDYINHKFYVLKGKLIDQEE